MAPSPSFIARLRRNRRLGAKPERVWQRDRAKPRCPQPTVISRQPEATTATRGRTDSARRATTSERSRTAISSRPYAERSPSVGGNIELIRRAADPDGRLLRRLALVVDLCDDAAVGVLESERVVAAADL